MNKYINWLKNHIDAMVAMLLAVALCVEAVGADIVFPVYAETMQTDVSTDTGSDVSVDYESVEAETDETVDEVRADDEAAEMPSEVQEPSVMIESSQTSQVDVGFVRSTFDQMTIEANVKGSLITVDGKMPEDVSMTAILIENTSVLSEYESVINEKLPASLYFNVTKAYDISLYNGDGSVYQPIDNGTVVSVTIDDSEIAGIDNPEVVRIEDDGSNITELDEVSRTDGLVTFDAEHFTVYVVGALTYTVDDTTNVVYESTVNNIKWTLYDTGLLVGTGNGSAYAGPDLGLYEAVFRDYANDITAIYCDCVLYNDCKNLFQKFENVEYFGTGENFGCSATTNFGNLFLNCSSLVSVDLSNWNTANVTDVSGMFSGCTDLSQAILSGWSTANITDTSYMFNKCSSLTSVDFTGWNTGSVENMTKMFADCSSLASLDVSGFNTASVRNFSYMFYNCASLSTLAVDTWNVGAATTLNAMFQFCTNMEVLNVSSWNTENVENMGYVFANCAKLVALDVADWNTSRVNTMAYLFDGCANIVILDVSQWDVKNVEKMTKMFSNCRLLSSLDLTGWITDSLTEVDDSMNTSSGMFYNCSSLSELDLSSLNFSQVSYATNLLNGCSALQMVKSVKTAPSGLVIRFPVVSGRSWYLDDAEPLCEADSRTAYTTMIVGNTNNPHRYIRDDISGFSLGNIVKRYNGITWTLYDDGRLVGTGDGHSYDGPKANVAGLAGDDTPVENGLIGLFQDESDKIKEIYCDCVLYKDCSYLFACSVVNTTSSQLVSQSYFMHCDKFSTGSSFSSVYVTNMSYMFYSCNTFTSIDVSKFNTSSVTNMAYIFYNCGGVSSLNVSVFDTSNVTNMSHMFDNCRSLTTLDVTSFNTSHVTNMDYMFYNCRLLTALDLSSFDTSRVTTMSVMFMDCVNLLVLDLHHFDVSNVTQLQSVFRNCAALQTINVTGWDTSHVITVYHLFDGCSHLTALDLSTWSLPSIASGSSTDVEKAFECANLQVLKAPTDLQASVSIFLPDASSKFYYLDDVAPFDQADSKIYYTKLITGDSVSHRYVRSDKESFSSSVAVLKPGSDVNAILKELQPDARSIGVVTDRPSDMSRAVNIACDDSIPIWAVPGTGFVYNSGAQQASSSSVAHTPNVSDTGVANGTYASGLNTKSVVKAPGSSLPARVTLKYGTESGYDCVYVFCGSYTGSISSFNQSFSGYKKVTGDLHSGEYSMYAGSGSNPTTVSFDVWSDTITFAFHSDGSSEYYGYFASVGDVSIRLDDTDLQSITDAPAIALYSDAEVLKLNADSDNLLSGLDSLQLAHLGDLDASLVTSAESFIDDCLALTYIVSPRSIPSDTSVLLPAIADKYWYCDNDKPYNKADNALQQTRMLPGYQVCIFYMLCDLVSAYTLKYYDNNKTTLLKEEVVYNGDSGTYSLPGVVWYDFVTNDIADLTDIHSDMSVYRSDVTVLEYGGITWTLYPDGTLIATGDGHLSSGPQWGISDEALFSTVHSKIKKVILDCVLYKDCSNLFIGAHSQSAYSQSHLNNLVNISVGEHFDSSYVENMRYMFYRCSSLTSLDVSHFDTSKVTNMSYMFCNCSSLTSLDVSHFDTSKVTNMSYMFCNCSSLTSLDVSHFDTSKVTSMFNMFYSCSRFVSLDVSHFDTSNVTTMSYMFCNCSSLTSLDVSHFDTSKVTNMSYMFYGCSNLSSLDVSYFDTSNVTDMTSMFSGCRDLSSLIVDHFNTSRVSAMTCMFRDCSSLTELDVTNFTIKFQQYSTVSLSLLFSGCSGLTSLDLSSFDLSRCSSYTDMLAGCSSLQSVKVSSNATSEIMLPRSDSWQWYLDDDAPYLVSDWNVSVAACLIGEPYCIHTYIRSDVAGFVLGDGATMLQSGDVINSYLVPEWTQFQSASCADLGISVDIQRMNRLYTNVAEVGCSPVYIIPPNSSVLLDSMVDSSPNFVSGVRQGSYSDNIAYAHTFTAPCASSLDVSLAYQLDYRAAAAIYVIPGAYSGTISTNLDAGQLWEYHVDSNSSYSEYGYSHSKTLTVPGDTVTIVFVVNRLASYYSSLNSSYAYGYEATIKGSYRTDDIPTLLSTGAVTYFNEDSSNMFANMTNLESVDLGILDASKVLRAKDMFKNDNNLQSIVSPKTIPVGLNIPLYSQVKSFWFLDDVEPFRIPDNGMPYHSFINGITDQVHKYVNSNNIETYPVNYYANDKTTLLYTEYVVSGTAAVYNMDKADWYDMDTDRVADLSSITVPRNVYAYQTYEKKLTYNGITWKLYENGLLEADGDGSLYNGPKKGIDGCVENGITGLFDDLSEKIKTINLNCKLYKDSSYLFADYLTGGGSSKYLKQLSAITFGDNFDSSSVLNMSHLFENTGLLSLDTSALNTSATTDLSYMFHNCSISGVLDLSHFDVSNVTDLSYMFADSDALTSLSLSGWDTSDVTDVSHMFANCTHLGVLNIDNDFVTSHVTDMADMFANCEQLSSLDISNFDTSNVTTMSNLFDGCKSLPSVSVLLWDVSNVTNMVAMFEDCVSMTSLDLSSWNMSGVADSRRFISGCRRLATFKAPKSLTAETIDGVDVAPISFMSKYGYEWFLDDDNNGEKDTATAYTEAIYNITDEPHTYIWIRSGIMESKIVGGADFNVKVKKLVNASVNTDSTVDNVIVDIKWIDTPFEGTVISTDDALTPVWMRYNSSTNEVELYTEADIVYLSTVSHMFNGFEAVCHLSLLSSKIDAAHLTTGDLGYVFNGCKHLLDLDLSKFDPIAVTTLSNTFAACESLAALDAHYLNTTNTTSMHGIFDGCKVLQTLNIGSFNTGNVTDMSNMFRDCTALTDLDVGQFNISNVSNLSSMLKGCGIMMLDISDWDWTNVADVSEFVTGCQNLVKIRAPKMIPSSMSVSLPSVSGKYWYVDEDENMEADTRDKYTSFIVPANGQVHIYVRTGLSGMTLPPTVAVFKPGSVINSAIKASDTENHVSSVSVIKSLPADVTGLTNVSIDDEYPIYMKRNSVTKTETTVTNMGNDSVSATITVNDNTGELSSALKTIGGSDYLTVTLTRNVDTGGHKDGWSSVTTGSDWLEVRNASNQVIGSRLTGAGTSTITVPGSSVKIVYYHSDKKSSGVFGLGKNPGNSGSYSATITGYKSVTTTTETDASVEFYSNCDRIRLNENAADMFKNMPALASVDLGVVGADNTTSAINMFMGDSSLVKVKAPKTIPDGLDIVLPVATGKSWYLDDNNDGNRDDAVGYTSMISNVVDTPHTYFYRTKVLIVSYMDDDHEFHRDEVDYGTNYSVIANYPTPADVLPFKRWKQGNSEYTSGQAYGTVTDDVVFTACYEELTTVPSGLTLTYNGSAQDLVSVGVTKYGTPIEYALSRTAMEAPDDDTIAITAPTATNCIDADYSPLGRYYIWYRVQGESDWCGPCQTTMNPYNRRVRVEFADIFADNKPSYPMTTLFAIYMGDSSYDSLLNVYDTETNALLNESSDWTATFVTLHASDLDWRNDTSQSQKWNVVSEREPLLQELVDNTDDNNVYGAFEISSSNSNYVYSSYDEDLDETYTTVLSDVVRFTDSNTITIEFTADDQSKGVGDDDPELTCHITGGTLFDYARYDAWLSSGVVMTDAEILAAMLDRLPNKSVSDLVTMTRESGETPGDYAINAQGDGARMAQMLSLSQTIRPVFVPGNLSVAYRSSYVVRVPAYVELNKTVDNNFETISNVNVELQSSDPDYHVHVNVKDSTVSLSTADHKRIETMAAVMDSTDFTYQSAGMVQNGKAYSTNAHLTVSGDIEYPDDYDGQLFFVIYSEQASAGGG